MLEYKGTPITGAVARDPNTVLFTVAPRQEDREEITKKDTLIRINDVLYKVRGHEWFLNNFGQPGHNVVLAVELVPEKTPRVRPNQDGGRILDL